MAILGFTLEKPEELPFEDGKWVVRRNVVRKVVGGIAVSRRVTLYDREGIFSINVPAIRPERRPENLTWGLYVDAAGDCARLEVYDGGGLRYVDCITEEGGMASLVFGEREGPMGLYWLGVHAVTALQIKEQLAEESRRICLDDGVYVHF